VQREQVAEVELGCLEELDLPDVDLHDILVQRRVCCGGVLLGVSIRSAKGRYPACSSQSPAPSPPGSTSSSAG